MSRIRTIKPDFWTSAQVMEVSPLARLIFVGMWNFCDDAGIFPASVKSLKAKVVPSDDITSDDILGLIRELIDVGLLEEYTAENQAYWQVTGWHHQRIDRPNYRYPTNPNKSSGMNPGILPDHSPPEGMEGKGKVEEGKEAASRVLEHLNKKAGKQFRPGEANLKFILARLDEYDEETLKRVVDDRVSRWATDAKMRDYLRPETLFNQTKCASYVGQLPAAKPGGKSLDVADVYEFWMKLGSPQKLARRPDETVEQWQQRLEEAA